MRTRLSVLVCTLVAIATLTAQSGQAPKEPQDTAPVFRVGANLVRVDMYATHNGQLVTDLRPEDVELYEDNVRQTIETFEFVRVDDARPVSDLAALTNDDSRTRIFVVFVDTNTAQLDGDNELKRALLRFLDRTVQPKDLVGLMTPDMSALDVTLGRRAAVMSDIANDQRWIRRPVPERANPKDFAWENCYSTGQRISRRVNEMKARRDGKATIDSLRDLIYRLRDLREERKAVLLVTGGWPFADDGILATGSENETRSCEEDRKTLLRVNYNSLLRELARSANRSNVSFYPVSSRRSAAVSRDIPAEVRNTLIRRERLTTELITGQLEELAQETDGVSESQMRNIDKVTERIINDTSAYYLLGYQSTNQRADWRFHTITVKVRRPDVVVRSRAGYGGENVRVVKLTVDPTRPLIDSRVSAAFTGIQRFEPDSQVWARTSAFSASAAQDGGAFWLVGQLGLRDVRWAGGVTEVIVTAADKKQVFSRTLDAKSRSDVFEMRVPDTGTLPLGNYSVRVRFRPANDGSPVVQDLPRVELVQAMAGLGEPVLWRRGPTVRNQFQQTADPRFRRNERLRLELLTDVEETPVARVLDRFGQPLQVPIDLSERSSEDGLRWVVADLPLVGLAPGDYAVSVTQRDKTQVAAFRMIP